MSGPGPQASPSGSARKEPSKRGTSQPAGWRLGAGDRRAGYLGVEDVAGNSTEHEQPIFLHGPGDTQPGHPLQGALVSLVMVTQLSAFFFWELF